MISGMWMAIGGPRVKRKLASYSPNFLPMSSSPEGPVARPDKISPRSLLLSRYSPDHLPANMKSGSALSAATNIGSSLLPGGERLGETRSPGVPFSIARMARRLLL